MLHSVGLRELLDFIKNILICVPKILQIWDDMRGSNDIIFTQLQNVLISCFSMNLILSYYHFTFSTLCSPPSGCFHSPFVLFSPLPSFVFFLLIHVQYIILLTGLLTCSISSA